MFDIGFAEMIIIALLGLVVLGPERLPQAIRTVARWLHYLKQTASNVRETVESELNIEEIKQDLHFKDIERQLESVKQQATEASDSLNNASSLFKGEVSDLNPSSGQLDDKKKAEAERPSN